MGKRFNLKYIPSLDPNFADFLADGNDTPLCRFFNDPESVAGARRTAAQQVTHLKMTLGQVANYDPIIARHSIIKNSTSVNGV